MQGVIADFSDVRDLGHRDHSDIYVGQALLQIVSFVTAVTIITLLCILCTEASFDCLHLPDPHHSHSSFARLLSVLYLLRVSHSQELCLQGSGCIGRHKQLFEQGRTRDARYFTFMVLL